MTDTKNMSIPNDDDLYIHCFCPEAPPSPREEPAAAFARVIKQIETIELPQRTYMDPRSIRARGEARGYVFVLHEQGSDKAVLIGYGGKTPMRAVLRQLQVGNARPLIIGAILQRESYDDAREIHDLIRAGLCMYRLPGSSWYRMDNCLSKIQSMFSRIDVVEETSASTLPQACRDSVLI